MWQKNLFSLYFFFIHTNLRFSRIFSFFFSLNIRVYGTVYNAGKPILTPGSTHTRHYNVTSVFRKQQRQRNNIILSATITMTTTWNCRIAVIGTRRRRVYYWECGPHEDRHTTSARYCLATVAQWTRDGRRSVVKTSPTLSYGPFGGRRNPLITPSDSVQHLFDKSSAKARCGAKCSFPGAIPVGTHTRRLRRPLLDRCPPLSPSLPRRRSIAAPAPLPTRSRVGLFARTLHTRIFSRRLFVFNFFFYFLFSENVSRPFPLRPMAFSRAIKKMKNDFKTKKHRYARARSLNFLCVLLARSRNKKKLGKLDIIVIKIPKESIVSQKSFLTILTMINIRSKRTECSVG